MGSLFGLLGGVGGEIAGDVLKSVLGGSGGGGDSNPLASNLGGQDSIGSGQQGGGLSSLMSIASLAAMFI